MPRLGVFKFNAAPRNFQAVIPRERDIERNAPLHIRQRTAADHCYRKPVAIGGLLQDFERCGRNGCLGRYIHDRTERAVEIGSD